MAKATGITSTGIETKDKGELSAEQYVFVAIPKVQYKLKGWFMGFQTAFKEVAKDKSLSGESKNVLIYLLGTMDFENFLGIEQKIVAEELGMKQSNVSRAMKELSEHGILEQGPKFGKFKTYKINLFYAWKGKAVNREKARKDKKPVAVAAKPKVPAKTKGKPKLRAIKGGAS